MEQASKIADLNDKFRRGAPEVMITPGVRELDDLAGLMAAVRRFDEFTENNDPYQEHDFGEIKWSFSKVYWKIDYYDPDLKYGLAPLDPKCRRIMTVMLASEY
jgi:hypothetical protein